MGSPSNTTLFPSVPLYPDQVNLLTPWTTNPANTAQYNTMRQMDNRQLSPQVWELLRFLSMPPAPQPVIWRVIPRVPLQPPAGPVSPYVVAPSDKHTSKPPMLYKFVASHFIDYWLSSKDLPIVQSLNTALPDRIENPCLVLDLESDVVRATNQYILPWVEMLAATYWAPKGVTITSKTESTTDGTRYDMAWETTFAGQTHIVLLLEFKGPGALVEDAWPAEKWDYHRWRSFQQDPRKNANVDTYDIFQNFINKKM